jgi:hypothetical protein
MMHHLQNVPPSLQTHFREHASLTDACAEKRPVSTVSLHNHMTIKTNVYTNESHVTSSMEMYVFPTLHLDKLPIFHHDNMACAQHAWVTHAGKTAHAPQLFDWKNLTSFVWGRTGEVPLNFPPSPQFYPPPPPPPPPSPIKDETVLA